MTRYLRYEHQGQTRYGRLDGEMIQPLEGEFAHWTDAAAPQVALAAVKLLAPAQPSKIVAIGPNFKVFFQGAAAHAHMDLTFWVKPPTVVNDPEGIIEMPRGVPAVNYEVELAFVIARTTKLATPEEAKKNILGFTLMNDVTAGQFNPMTEFRQSTLFAYGKTYDGFGPLGPWIVTDLDTRSLRMQTRVNGEIRQDHTTADFIHQPHEVLSAASHVMTLLPGDVISLGSPPGVGPMQDGDVVEIEIEGVGTLRNHARDRGR
jgi:2-keto-4-pentenoate hydratase/2-oxohepta-3-ene-1,7-dioic acid hydratase in catechol pathway